jgi:hypothetical protein
MTPDQSPTAESPNSTEPGAGASASGRGSLERPVYSRRDLIASSSLSVGLGAAATLGVVRATERSGPPSGSLTSPNGLSANRGATVIVAASNASAASQASANYVCDGVGDDAEIQAAFDALPSAGGRVQLTEGTFFLKNGVAFPSVPFTFSGQGQGASYLRFTDDVKANMFSYTSRVDLTFAKISDMTLYGNAANECRGSGIYINSTGKFWDIRFQDLFVLDFTDYGFFCNYAHDYVFDHVIVEYCGTLQSPARAAVNLAGGDEAFFSNCLIKLNNGRGCSVGTYGTTISNTHFVQNAESGLLIDAEDCTICGCVFDDNSYGAEGKYPQFRSLSARTCLSASTFFGHRKSPSSCVYLDVNSSANVVANNSFADYRTQAVEDHGSGSPSIFVGNLGCPDRFTNGLSMPSETRSASSVVTTQSFTIRVNSEVATDHRLPDPGTCPGQIFIIKNVGSAPATISGPIDGSSQLTLNARYDFATVQSNGSTYDCLGAGSRA